MRLLVLCASLAGASAVSLNDARLLITANGTQYTQCANAVDMCHIDHTCVNDVRISKLVFECCPLKGGNACEDSIHCCPSSHPHCDLHSKECVALSGSEAGTVPLSRLIPALSSHKTEVPPMIMPDAWDLDYIHNAKGPLRRSDNATEVRLARADAKAAASKEPWDYTFQMLGDWGISTDVGSQTAMKDVMKVLWEKGDAYASNFLVSMGDNFYNNGVDSVDDWHWDAVYNGIYNEGNLWNAWYCVFGNHDHYGNEQAQIDYSVDNWRWNFPASYYSVQYDLPDESYMVIIYLDSGVNGDQLIDDQLDWLESKLAQHNDVAKYILVVGHHPAYSGGNHGDTQTMIDNLQPLLSHYTVTAYIAGHDHGMQHIVMDGVDHFVNGAGGYHTDSSMDWKPETAYAVLANGCMRWTISDDGSMLVRMYNQWGESLYTTTLGPRNV